VSDTPDASDSAEQTAADGAETEIAVAERVPDPVRDPIIEQVTAALGGDVLGTLVHKGDMWARVDRGAWRRTAEYLKAHGFTYFCFLSGIDWLRNPELSNRYEQVFTGDEPAADSGNAGDEGGDETTGASPAIETGVTGGDTRFQVFLRLYDIDRKIGITIKADLDDTAPEVESIVTVFRGAEWHERETWEMFGFDFIGHPGLRHLYLPSEFEGFPLRKDFPLLARVVKPWPGLVDKEPVPGEDEEEEAAAT
jgi:NADH-quinone oxidoreductase subunit C